jgi:glutathione S-transferase
MPKLYHSPNSRSSRVVAQLMRMDKLDAVEVIIVDVPRHDGTGKRDPRNPHPEGKVPYLVTDEGVGIRESAAIMMYLDELFGQPLSPAIGSAERGSYLSWMAYSGGVLEPVLVAAFSGLDHPALHETFRGMPDVSDAILQAVQGADFLLGDRLTVADILLASPFQWAPHLMPDNPEIKAWVDRVAAQLDGQAIAAFEARAVQERDAVAAE